MNINSNGLAQSNIAIQGASPLKTNNNNEIKLTKGNEQINQITEHKWINRWHNNKESYEYY